MISSAERHGADIGCCGTCLDARGISDELLVKAARRATLDELADWTLWTSPAPDCHGRAASSPCRR
jgi:uncharacterized protein involved in oxidation of intracellular sulfur